MTDNDTVIRAATYSGDPLDELAERLEAHLDEPALIGTIPNRGGSGALVVLAPFVEQLLDRLEDRVCGAHELAEHEGVSRATVHRWQRVPGFPAPRTMVSGNPGWSLREVRGWRAQR